MISATTPSTGADDRDRERREGSVLWARTKAELDELVELRATVKRQRTAQAGNARTAHAARSERLRAAILAMAECHRPQLEVWTGSKHSRAVFLRNQIKAAIELDDAKPKQYMGLEKPPGWRLIDDVLNSLLV